jgi:hypothetical protein
MREKALNDPAVRAAIPCHLPVAARFAFAARLRDLVCG